MTDDPNKWGVWSAAEVHRRLDLARSVQRKRRKETAIAVLLIGMLALSVGASLYLLVELCEWLRVNV